MANLLKKHVSDVSTNYPDINGYTYDGVSLSMNPPEATPWGIEFKPDGTKMYITGNTSDKCRQYSGTAWDLSTFTSDSKEYSFASETTQPWNIRWKSDGTKCYVAGRNTRTIFQYSASTAWDISSLSYDSVSLVLNDTSNTLVGLIFSDDGTKLITLQETVHRHDRYDLSSAWDLSTASYVSAKSIFFEAGLVDTNLSWMNPNGLQYYCGDVSGDNIAEFSLVTPWDLSDLSTPWDSILDVTTEESQLRSIYISPDGSKLYVVGTGNDTVYQYSKP